MKKTISLALDGVPVEKAFNLVRGLRDRVKSFKLHDLLDAYGPEFLHQLGILGVQRWVDYKLHDTKDTVALRVRALIGNGASIITVHASGGVEMMKAAVEATIIAGEPAAEIYAITVLTSLDDKETARSYGADRTREQIVHEFALMAYEAGVRTVVCSALEVAMLKQSAKLPDMKFTVPGTRSAGVALGQQKRSGTPAQAIIDGASELVAGSQVTKAQDPIAAFDAMAAEIGETLR